MSRPYFRLGAKELEELFEQHRSDPNILNQLKDELEHRKTAKSKKLQENVEKVIKELTNKPAQTQSQPFKPQAPPPPASESPTLKGSPLSQFSVNRQYNSSVSVTHRIKATNIYFNAPDISMSWFALVDGAAPVTPQAPLKGSEPFKGTTFSGILLRIIRGGEFIAT
jgi:hypothetical protein